MTEKPNPWTSPPAVLDGAKVLYSGVLQKFDHPLAAAICSYPGAQEVYLFYCDDQWQVIEDWDHDSVEEAIASLEQRYPDARGKLIGQSLVEIP